MEKEILTATYFCWGLMRIKQICGFVVCLFLTSLVYAEMHYLSNFCTLKARYDSRLMLNDELLAVLRCCA